MVFFIKKSAVCSHNSTFIAIFAHENRDVFANTHGN